APHSRTARRGGNVRPAARRALERRAQAGHRVRDARAHAGERARGIAYRTVVAGRDWIAPAPLSSDGVRAPRAAGVDDRCPRTRRTSAAGGVTCRDGFCIACRYGFATTARAAT